MPTAQLVLHVGAAGGALYVVTVTVVVLAAVFARCQRRRHAAREVLRILIPGGRRGGKRS